MILALSFGLVASFGCTPGKHPPEPPEPDAGTPEKFHLERHEPAPGSTKVSVHALVRARFEAPLDPATLSEERVHLLTHDGAEVSRSLQLSEDHRELTVTPAAPFQTDQEYQLTFSPGLKSTDGRELDTGSEPWTWYVPPPAWLSVGGPMWGGQRTFMAMPILTFDSEGAPVVGWCEGGSDGVDRVFVRRWDGTAWVALGTGLTFDDYCPSRLSLQSGPSGQLWLWRWWKQELGLVNWNGSVWQQVWRSSQGVSPAAALRVDSTNRLVSYFDGSVKRFSGGQWEDLGMPPVPDGKGQPMTSKDIHLAVMLDAQERPLLAQMTVASWEFPGGAIRLSRWDGGVWEVLGEVWTPAFFPSTDHAIFRQFFGGETDSLGQPVLGWYREQTACTANNNCTFSQGSRFTRWSNGSWTPMPGRTNRVEQIVVAPTDAVLIRSSEPVSNPPNTWEEVISRLNGEVWETVGSFPEGSSAQPLLFELAASPEGVPHVAYVESTQDGGQVRVVVPNR